MKFERYEGAGNSFLFFKGFLELSIPAYADFVRRISSKEKGWGVDGCVFMEAKKGRGQWAFFNCDGSIAEFCGNAARCAVLWSKRHDCLDQNSHFRWESAPFLNTSYQFKGNIVGQSGVQVCCPIDSSELEVEKITSKDGWSELFSGLGSNFQAAFWINTGVPHLVILGGDDWEKTEIYSHSFQLRKASQHFRQGGANVTWVSKSSRQVATFERGVEDITPACGSGAFAAFLALEEMNCPMEGLHFPGGKLSVFRSEDDLILEGPTSYVGYGVDCADEKES